MAMHGALAAERWVPRRHLPDQQGPLRRESEPRQQYQGKVGIRPEMKEQDQRIGEVVAREGARLRSFIRRQVADPLDAEDVLQDVFYKLVEANRLLMPIDHVTGWLFRVARNRIIDLFRKNRTKRFSEMDVVGEEGERLEFEDLLPSPDAGPEAEHLRGVLLEELELAIGRLPREQREVFVAHELEGRSFAEIGAESGVSVNTLLARKRYAVLRLREWLSETYEEFRMIEGCEKRSGSRIREQ